MFDYKSKKVFANHDIFYIQSSYYQYVKII